MIINPESPIRVDEELFASFIRDQAVLLIHVLHVLGLEEAVVSVWLQFRHPVDPIVGGRFRSVDVYLEPLAVLVVAVAVAFAAGFAVADRTEVGVDQGLDSPGFCDPRTLVDELVCRGQT